MFFLFLLIFADYKYVRLGDFKIWNNHLAELNFLKDPVRIMKEAEIKGLIFVKSYQVFQLDFKKETFDFLEKDLSYIISDDLDTNRKIEVLELTDLSFNFTYIIREKPVIKFYKWKGVLV